MCKWCRAQEEFDKAIEDIDTGRGSAVVPGYARPKTRGELRDLLSNGVACEVVETNVEITSLMLKGWLDFESFTVRKSENKGWSVFEA